jgi:hypothetical protein
MQPDSAAVGLVSRLVLPVRVAAVADAVYLDLGMANEGLTEYREHALPAY